MDLESLKALAHPLRVRILDTLSAWVEASAVGLANVVVTTEQLQEFSELMIGLITEFSERYRDQKPTGSRPVQLQFHAFPVMDGVINSNDAASASS